MSSQWNQYVELPESRAGTPLKLRNPGVDNLQSSNEKKRGPTTPLTPTLIRRNIVKKQYLHHKQNENGDVLDEFKDPTNAEQGDVQSLDIGVQKQENEENYMFKDQSGSPKSRRSSTPVNMGMAPLQNNTPKISAGIKQAVKDHKKSRLHILRTMDKADISVTESEYSETSTISGETPNYKMKENLVYYKNGYYLGNADDSFAELERESLVNEKELNRVNSLIDFMKMERQFEKE
jgi:hypothetical protein